MLIFVAGARPNYVKVKPLIDYCISHKVPYLFYNANQHQENMQTFNLGNQKPYKDLPRYARIAEIITEFGNFLKEAITPLMNPIVVLVGDTDTSFAAAVTANALGLPIAHIEAGIRSGYNIPEEYNRKFIDSVSTYWYTPTKEAAYTLADEFKGDYIRENLKHVGNIMIEVLIKEFLAKAPIGAPSPYGQYVLVELHRQENDCIIGEVVKVMEKLDIPVIWVMHPRNYFYKIKEKAHNITFLEPQTYYDFNNLLYNARLVVTDSGGVQADSSVLHVSCLTLRQGTEWGLTITHGTNELVTLANLKESINRRLSSTQLNNFDLKKEKWDDKVSERIIKDLVERMS